MQLMEPFVVQYDVANVGDVRHCKVEITRRLDNTVVILHGYGHTRKQYPIPANVVVYYPTEESESWTHNKEYRRVLDADLVQEIDNQIPVMYLALA